MAEPRSAASFVGRSTELGVLRAAVERASSGDPACVLVSGPAGVGKSRLVDEAMQQARSVGALVLVGRCVDVGDGELAYAPIAAMLRALPSHVEWSELDDALGEGRRDLARLAPALGGGDADFGVGPARYGKERLFEFLLGALGRLSAARPVVCVVEDLHWSDGSSRDMLRFLVRSVAEERVALVLTCRSDDLDRRHPVRPYLVELRRDPRVECIDLVPFSRAEFADHVAAVLGTVPPPATLDELYARSEGNPFFTEELLGSGDPADLPPSIRDAMAVHLEQLSPAAQRVVRVLAAAGRQVDHRLLERAAVLPARDLTAGVREAVDARVLVPDRDGHGYEFRHALLREVAYADLLPGEREALHNQVARELEADPPVAGDGATSAAEVAHHWDAAGDRERALRAWVRAAGEAEQLFAHPEALRHLQRALELWALAPTPARRGLDQVALTERAADAASAAGDAQLAIALAEPASAGPQHARLARLLWDGGRGADGLAVSAQAMALTPPARTPERARMLESRARLLSLTGRADGAQPLIDEAIGIAQELDAPDIEAAALATRVIATGDRVDAATAAGCAAMEAAARDGDPDTLMRAYINGAEALDHAGQVEEAIALARDGVAEARRLGMERVMGVHMQGEIAGRLIKLGRHAEAAEAIEDGLRLSPEGSAAVALGHAAAAFAARRGDADAAVAALRGVEADDAGSGQSTAGGAAALAELALWARDPTRAWELVDEALTRVQEAEYVWYSAPLYALGTWAWADRSLTARARHDDVVAVEAHAAALDLVARLDDRLCGSDVPEPAAFRAEIAAELTRLVDESDPGAWGRARRRWQVLGFPFHAAVCGWRQAEALLRAGDDRQRATELLVEAAAGADALGAVPLAAAVTATARAARVAIGRGDDTPGAPPAGLTSRELDVLRLMARGHTNREIGAALFISAKTVSVHVSHVLAKLGAANRAEAATIAARLGVDEATS
jgi:DNA-binding CsgD family transcriptional regulator/tetratricopeptide (TPR) repeat protein